MNPMIANKLTPIWSELKTIIQSDSDWYMKAMQHEDKKLLQWVYLIRYYPAFLFEYYKMFSYLLEQKPKSVQVLSIGNGPSIDFDALQLARSERKDVEIESYLGIEKTLWTECETIQDINRTQIWGTVEDLSFANISPTILFFPKSLHSLTYLEFEALKQQLQRSIEIDGPITLAISYQWEKYEFERNRIQSILHVLSQWHKLEVKEKFCEKGTGTHLEKLDYRFEYPLSVANDCIRWNLKDQGLNPLKTDQQLSYEIFSLDYQ